MTENPRWQFSLWHLMLAVTIFALLLGLFPDWHTRLVVGTWVLMLIELFWGRPATGRKFMYLLFVMVFVTYAAINAYLSLE